MFSTLKRHFKTEVVCFY